MSQLIKRILKLTRRFDVAWEESAKTGVIEVAKLRQAQRAGELDRTEKTDEEN